MDIDVDTSSIARMATRYAGAGPVVVEEMRTAMNRSVLTVEASAKRVVPVDTGNLRRSITHEVTATGGGLIGKVGTNVPYARYVEEGRSAGSMPPPDALARDLQGGWLRRHGISNDLAFVVARAIARRGIRPRPYLKPAITTNRARIEREFAQVPKRVLARIGAGR